MVAVGFWGARAGGWVFAALLPAIVMVLWFLFASPKAPYGARCCVLR